jgi:hypothetical protein
MTLFFVALPAFKRILLYMSRSIKRPYRKSRRFDKTCRNHGSCSYCRNNRLYSSNKKLIAFQDEKEEEEE